RLLKRVQLAVFLESLDGRNLARGDGAELGDARAGRRPVNEHRAGAAAPLSAAVFGSGQAEVVAEHAQQRSLAFRVDSDRMAVDREFRDFGNGKSPRVKGQAC